MVAVKNWLPQKETSKSNQYSTTKERVMTTQTREGGKKARARKKDIVRFKLSLVRGMNSRDDSCTHHTVCGDDSCTHHTVCGHVLWRPDSRLWRPAVDFIVELIEAVCDIIHMVQDGEGKFIYPVKLMIFYWMMLEKWM